MAILGSLLMKFTNFNVIDHVMLSFNASPLVKSNIIFFSYFSTKTYVVGTQNNHLTETVILSTQNIF